MVDIVAGEETFDRDESFDLATHWRLRSAEFIQQMLAEQVTVRLSPRGLRALRWAAESPLAYTEALAAAGEPDGQGWVTTRLPVESIEVAYDVLLRLGPEVEVLDPPELRARFAEAANRLAGIYEPRSDSGQPDRRRDQA
ncbi:MAG TPA: WYL domain-containing protein [Micromonosporaceae bacterium]|nr:WYL domain-containing protein [Micromonosporaceae bacterium]